jgi:hypothetical protein
MAGLTSPGLNGELTRRSRHEQRSKSTSYSRSDATYQKRRRVQQCALFARGELPAPPRLNPFNSRRGA